jgi:hypothetical protein
VLAAAVVAEQSAAMTTLLSAVVVAKMPSARQMEEEMTEAGGVADPDHPCRVGVKVRPGRIAAVDVNLAARNTAARAIQGATHRRLLTARPVSRPPDPAAPRLVHVGTAFFDGMHSAGVRACLSERFAGGLPLVGSALPRGVRSHR